MRNCTGACTIFAGIIGVFATFGNCGKKASIIGRRLGASTIVQLMHHRFQSKRLVCSTFIQLALSGSSVLTYALNPNLTEPDYAVVYLSTTMLSGVLAGFVIIACFAAVQSTVAGLLLVTAASVCKDLYQDCFHPEASERSVSRFNAVALTVISVLAVLIGMYPTRFTQLLNTFSGAGLDLVFVMPLLFGLFWKGATEMGAISCVVGGLGSYVLMYLSRALSPEFWRDYLLDMHPIVPSMVLSLVLMVVVSRRTAKVPLGICEVWFSSDYAEQFCHEYNLRGKHDRNG